MMSLWYVIHTMYSVSAHASFEKLPGSRLNHHWIVSAHDSFEKLPGSRLSLHWLYNKI